MPRGSGLAFFASCASAGLTLKELPQSSWPRSAELDRLHAEIEKQKKPGVAEPWIYVPIKVTPHCFLSSAARTLRRRGYPIGRSMPR